MNANIQIQNISGTWFTIQTVPNKGQFVRKALEQAKITYNKRVKAVDSNGNLIDMM
jgi:hypothetical protein